MDCSKLWELSERFEGNFESSEFSPVLISSRFKKDDENKALNYILRGENTRVSVSIESQRGKWNTIIANEAERNAF